MQGGELPLIWLKINKMATENKSRRYVRVVWRSFDTQGKTVYPKVEQHILRPAWCEGVVDLAEFKKRYDRPPILKSFGVQEQNGVDIIEVEDALYYEPRGLRIEDG